MKALLLRAWRDIPFPSPLRRWLLRRLNPQFLVGAVALIQDGQGRVLLLEHTYRRERPWGLPGGFLGQGETPEEALRRELAEETGWTVDVGELLAAQGSFGDEVGLLFRCHIQGGSYRPCAEARRHGWFAPDALPPMPQHQLDLLRRVKIGGVPFLP